MTKWSISNCTGISSMRCQLSSVFISVWVSCKSRLQLSWHKCKTLLLQRKFEPCRRFHQRFIAVCATYRLSYNVQPKTNFRFYHCLRSNAAGTKEFAPRIAWTSVKLTKPYVTKQEVLINHFFNLFLALCMKKRFSSSSGSWTPLPTRQKMTYMVLLIYGILTKFNIIVRMCCTTGTNRPRYR